MGGPRAGLCWPFTPEAYPPVEIDNLAAASESGMRLSGHGMPTRPNTNAVQETKTAMSSKRDNGQGMQPRSAKASRDGKPLNPMSDLTAPKALS